LFKKIYFATNFFSKKIVTKSQNKFIFCFSLSGIINAEPNSTIPYEYKSKNSFYAWNDTNFGIFPNQKEIIGVDNFELESITIENITKENQFKKPIRIRGIHKHRILTLQLFGNRRLFLSGDQGGRIIQFELISSNSFKIVKDYGYLNIGSINCSTSYKQYALFGGSHGHFMLIDTFQRKVIEGPQRTGVEDIQCVSLYEEFKGKFVVCVGGSPVKSDEGDKFYFDVHQTFKKCCYKFEI
jgi:hypothetical protein